MSEKSRVVWVEPGRVPFPCLSSQSLTPITPQTVFNSTRLIDATVSPTRVLSDPAAQAAGLHIRIPVPGEHTPHSSGGKT